MARRHGHRPHMVSGACKAKKSCFTTYDAAWAAVARTPGAIRAYLGKCCGYWHITRYEEDEYAQRVAEYGVQEVAACDIVVVDERTPDEDQSRDAEARPEDRQPREGSGGPGAPPLFSSTASRSAPSPAEVARRLEARRSA